MFSNIEGTKGPMEQISALTAPRNADYYIPFRYISMVANALTNMIIYIIFQHVIVNKTYVQ